MNPYDAYASNQAGNPTILAGYGPSGLDLRREALQYACTVASSLGSASVLKAADEFYAFLKGKPNGE